MAKSMDDVIKEHLDTFSDPWVNYIVKNVSPAMLDEFISACKKNPNLPRSEVWASVVDAWIPITINKRG